MFIASYTCSFLFLLHLFAHFSCTKPCPVQVSGSSREAEAAPPSITVALVSHQRRFSETRPRHWRHSISQSLEGTGWRWNMRGFVFATMAFLTCFHWWKDCSRSFSSRPHRGNTSHHHNGNFRRMGRRLSWPSTSDAGLSHGTALAGVCGWSCSYFLCLGDSTLPYGRKFGSLHLPEVRSRHFYEHNHASMHLCTRFIAARVGKSGIGLRQCHVLPLWHLHVNHLWWSSFACWLEDWIIAILRCAHATGYVDRISQLHGDPTVNPPDGQGFISVYFQPLPACLNLGCGVVIVRFRDSSCNSTR